jgi:hypothetical protein
MKKLFPIVLFLFPTSVFANQPFKYQTPCYIETKKEFSADICTVVETREKGGALKTRNIYSNRFGLTIKGRFDTEKGYMTWDSHNKYEYKWEYKPGSIGTEVPHTYVMPGVLLENVSWY